MSFRLYNVQHTIVIVDAKHIKNWMHASNFSAVHWAIETPVAKACVGEGWEIREIKQLLPKMSEQLSDECFFFFPFSVFVSFWFRFGLILFVGENVLQNIDKKRCDEMIMEICLHVEAMGAVFQKYLKIYDPLTSLVMPRKEKKHVMSSFGGLNSPGWFDSRVHLEPLKQQTRVLMQNFAWQIHYLQIWELPKQVKLIFFVSTKSSGGFCLETSVFFLLWIPISPKPDPTETIRRFCSNFQGRTAARCQMEIG